MALNIFIPSHGGQGVNLQIGDTNGDGKVDFGLGVRQYQGYGNGYAGAYSAGEVGFNTGRGVYLDGMNGASNGFQRQDNYWGIDTSGTTRGSSTYSDVFGNYQNNRYANDVWGNYYQGNTSANMWGYSNSDVAGNAWNGSQRWAHQQGDVFGNFGWNAGSVPAYGHRCYHAGGGYSAGGWFGGGCF